MLYLSYLYLTLSINTITASKSPFYNNQYAITLLQREVNELVDYRKTFIAEKYLITSRLVQQEWELNKLENEYRPISSDVIRNVIYQRMRQISKLKQECKECQTKIDFYTEIIGHKKVAIAALNKMEK